MHQTIFELPEFSAHANIINKIPHASVYVVGGAVRDILMSTPEAPIQPKDIDFVIVGVSAEEMKSNFPEWEVHGAFMVFIDPVYKCEFALARTERKVGASYTGFEVITDPSLTIEQDLLRRDLTINSIAINCVTGELVDPYNGAEHIKQKRLVPTSPAFMEDPLRILRVARFKARFGPDWAIDESVIHYANMMRANQEFDTIHISRIVMEMEKALQTAYPHLFFETCEEIGVSGLYHDFTDSRRIKRHVRPDVGMMQLVPFMVATAHDINTCLVFGIDKQSLKILADVPQLTQVDDLCRAISAMKSIKHPRTIEILFTAASYKYGEECFRHMEYFTNLLRDVTFTSLIDESCIDKNIDPTLRAYTVNRFIIRAFATYMSELK